jgi:hypothetical protein
MANVSRTLFLWSLAVGSAAIAAKGPVLLTLPAIALSSASAMVAYQESRKHRLSDWALEVWDVSLCLGTLAPSGIAPTATTHAIANLPGPVADWLVNSTVDPTTADFWTAKRARASKIYVGARGSGKSYLVNFHCSQMAQDGIDLKISDRHYPEGEHEWLPGIDRDTFEQRYLIRDAADSHKAIMHLQQTLHNRIEGMSQDKSPKHLVLDEWGGLIRKWTPQETKAAVQAIEFIFDEGRKFGIDVSIVVHGLTREKTELDEAITGAADLYLMGDSLSQTTYTYPASLARERGRLLDARQKAIAAVQPPQRVLIFRDALSGEAYPVVAPDLSTPDRLEVGPSVDEWMAEHSSLISDRIAQGQTARQISDELKVKRSKDNPQWAALKTLVQEQAPHA